MSPEVQDAADVRGPLRLSLVHVLLGGMLGGAARVALLATPGLETRWAVLAANLLGALALGILFERLAEHRLRRSATWAFWGPGVLGAFTTFSAMALLIADPLRDGDAVGACSYVAASLLLGWACAALGRRLGGRRA